MANEYLQAIVDAAGTELPLRLRAQQADAERVQREVLLDIVAAARDTEFGRAHGFADVRTVEDFRAAVPVSAWSDYAEASERMQAGAEDVLFPGRASAFIGTSGTTGTPKYIPDSAVGETVKSEVVRLRTAEMIRCFPHLLAADSKVFSISNTAAGRLTSGGIRVGTASGQAAGASDARLLSLPVAVLMAPHMDSALMDYLTVLYNLAQPGVVALACNNVSQFAEVLQLMNDRAETFIHDIETGSFSCDFSGHDELAAQLWEGWKPDPARAADLRAILARKGRLDVADVWPRFELVGCWTSGSVGRSVAEFRRVFPEGTSFFDFGYGASEGKFNVPFQPDDPYGYPAVFGIFFEFAPLDGGDPVMLHQAVDGVDYELVVTTYSGLYRYNIRDIVRVRTTPEGFKTIAFAAKASDRIAVGGAALYAHELTEMVEGYERESGAFLRVFQGFVEDGALRVEAEPDPSRPFDAGAFEAHLRDALAARGISFARLEALPCGTRDRLFLHKGASGGNTKQTKIPVFPGEVPACGDAPARGDGGVSGNAPAREGGGACDGAPARGGGGACGDAPASDAPEGRRA